MTLPYENATSGAAALDEIRKMLTRLNCARFGTMTDTEHGELIIQFTYRDRDIIAKASYKGYAAALMRDKPFNNHRKVKQIDYERKMLAQAEISVCSILRDWMKGQITAVETGVLSFEGAFLGQIMLPNGKTIFEEVQSKKLLALPGKE